MRAPGPVVERSATAAPSKPITVEVRQPDPSALETLATLIAPLVHPLATTGIVVIFVIFILVQQQDLAKKLSNPVADLISVPFQFNFDGRVGPARDGSRQYLNLQPVIPIKLNTDWNLISRTILPVVDRRRGAP